MWSQHTTHCNIRYCASYPLFLFGTNSHDAGDLGFISSRSFQSPICAWMCGANSTDALYLLSQLLNLSTLQLLGQPRESPHFPVRKLYNRTSSHHPSSNIAGASVPSTWLLLDSQSSTTKSTQPFSPTYECWLQSKMSLVLVNIVYRKKKAFCLRVQDRNLPSTESARYHGTFLPKNLAVSAVELQVQLTCLPCVT